MSAARRHPRPGRVPPVPARVRRPRPVRVQRRPPARLTKRPPRCRWPAAQRHGALGRFARAHMRPTRHRDSGRAGIGGAGPRSGWRPSRPVQRSRARRPWPTRARQRPLPRAPRWRRRHSGPRPGGGRSSRCSRARRRSSFRQGRRARGMGSQGSPVPEAARTTGSGSGPHSSSSDRCIAGMTCRS